MGNSTSNHINICWFVRILIQLKCNFKYDWFDTSNHINICWFREYWFNWNVTSNETCLILEDSNHFQVDTALLHCLRLIFWLFLEAFQIGSSGFPPEGVFCLCLYLFIFVCLRLFICLCLLICHVMWSITCTIVWLKVKLNAAGRYIKIKRIPTRRRSGVPCQVSLSFDFSLYFDLPCHLIYHYTLVGLKVNWMH